MAVSNVPAASAAGLQPKYQKFTSSGTFTLPTGYGAAKPLLVNIQVLGGGGAGGGTLISSGNTYGQFRSNDYFGNSASINIVGNASVNGDNATGGAGGGSGGLAQTQLYLTSNLTITVGAAGVKAAAGAMNFNGSVTNSSRNDNMGVGNTHNFSTNVNSVTGGSGGESSAGSIKAAGGSGGIGGLNISFTATINARNTTWDGTNNNIGTANANVNAVNASTGTGGAGGTPAGTQGNATPLLGTLAGGSGNTSPLFGSFGIGGKSGDLSTSTGVEGTGGGVGSNGASGAVILTWWE